MVPEPTAVPAESRARVAAARVARLATVRSDGRPHLVPVTFALVGDHVVSAVDEKPKRTQDLQRLRNIAATPQVSLLVDAYSEDWSQLWWVRLDGSAEIVADGPRRTELVQALVEKYPQYQAAPPPGPVIVMAVERHTAWSAHHERGSA